MKREKWIWMGHAGHFILGPRCEFHLATCVGKYIVSTVGELKSQGWKQEKFDTVGRERLYETMVFKAEKSDHKCCPMIMETAENVDFAGYNDPGDATKGHYKLCLKYGVKNDRR